MYLIQSLRKIRIKPLIYPFLARNYINFLPQSIMEPPATVKATDKITLNDYEKKLFEDLLNIVHKKNLGTTLRVAGGWVRDKIMGKDCYDIDIALDNLHGEAFATHIQEAIPGTKGFGVIKKNSEKSKHLETATIQIHGRWIDLVNLRSEKYTEHSRVPIIDIGTPAEDAYRRDLTINSLFYNINENKLEDFTKQGLTDIENGIIRTPLEPLQTFLDDPLRVLRTVRFAVRFGFKIVPEVISAAKNKEVLDALATKVSNERITKELDLMFSGQDPHVAVQLLYELNILSHSLKVPETCKELASDPTEKQRKAFESLKSVQDPTIFGQPLNLPEKVDLYYLALILPYVGHKYTQKGKKINVYEYVINEGLKKPNAFMKLAKTCYENLEWIRKAVNEPFDVISTGYLLKDLGDTRAAAMLTSFCQEYNKYAQCKQTDVEYKMNESLIGALIEKYRTWVQNIIKANIWNADKIKPFFDGKELASMFGVGPGKIMKHLVNNQFSWQLMNPIKTKEDYATHVAQNKESILSTLKEKK